MRYFFARVHQRTATKFYLLRRHGFSQGRIGLICLLYEISVIMRSRPVTYYFRDTVFILWGADNKNQCA